MQQMGLSNIQSAPQQAPAAPPDDSAPIGAIIGGVIGGIVLLALIIGGIVCLKKSQADARGTGSSPSLNSLSEEMEMHAGGGARRVEAYDDDAL